MSTTPDSTISPPKEDLKAAVASLKKEHPALRIAKLHALLLSENSSWAVSKKRVRRILKSRTRMAPSHNVRDLSMPPPAPLVRLDLLQVRLPLGLRRRTSFTHRPRSSKVLTSPNGPRPSKTNILIGKKGKDLSRRCRFRRAKLCGRRIPSS
jgi:hypothetical protein